MSISCSVAFVSLVNEEDNSGLNASLIVDVSCENHSKEWFRHVDDVLCSPFHPIAAFVRIRHFNVIS